MQLLAPAPAYVPAGLRALLVTSWVAGASYVYDGAERNIINELPAGLAWWPIDCRQAPKACQFGEAFGVDKNGRGFQQAITAALPGMAPGVRSGLNGLLAAGPLLALAQDMSGTWWLYGQDFGLRLPAYTANSGPEGGETVSSWQLVGRQRFAARPVALDGPIAAVDYGPGSGGAVNPNNTLPFVLA